MTARPHHPLALALAGAVVTIGCQSAAPPPSKAPPAVVTVARPVVKRVVPTQEFTGHTEAVEASKAAAERSRLNLDWTKVTAPVTGRVGRNLLTVGNLVAADQTLLTTIVSLDPIYAYIDTDEQTLLRIQRLIAAGRIDDGRTTRKPFFLAVADEEDFPHKGELDFVDNQLNPSTGTITVRGLFPNPDGFLTPGLFVRVRAEVGDAHQALLVSERALAADQGGKFVYVVNDKNEVEQRPVATGGEYGGLREVRSGLDAADRVVVNGLQRVRPGVTVDAKEAPMPVPPRQESAPKSGK